MTVEPEISRAQFAQFARVHPTAWAIYANRHAGDGTWENAQHFDFLADRVLKMKAEQDRILAGGKPSMEPGAQRLCVSMPPGFGKSEYLSFGVASWLFGARPQGRVVIASYSRSLAVGWGKRARDTFAELGAEVFGVTADPRQRADEWVARDPVIGTAHAPGYFYSVGRGGTFTGKRAEVLIIDDLLKDDLEAQSPAVRAHAWAWLDKVAMTRLLPWSIVIMIATRWHPEDPIGKLEAKQEAGEVDKPWDFVNLPALAGEGDPLGRAPGESLWPQMWSSEALESIKRGRDPRTWEALYQGRPVPQGGAMIDPAWLVPYEEAGEELKGQGREPIRRDELIKFATIDLAYTTKKTSDYTVITVFGADLDRGDLYLLHVERDRIGAEDLASRIRGVFEAFGVRKGYVERSGLYHDIVTALREEVPLATIQPNRDKVARAQPLIKLAASGALLVKQTAPWLRDLKLELEQFPAASNDDQVDALSYGAKVFKLMMRGRKVRTRYRKKKKGAARAREPVT